MNFICICLSIYVFIFQINKFKDWSRTFSLFPFFNPLIFSGYYTGCSERRLIGHSFYRRNFLRKSYSTWREKCGRAAPRTEKSDKPVQWTLCILEEKNARQRFGKHIYKVTQSTVGPPLLSSSQLWLGVKKNSFLGYEESTMDTETLHKRPCRADSVS
jgi:hypothetical protein